jgi:hypothetical protein
MSVEAEAGKDQIKKIQNMMLVLTDGVILKLRASSINAGSINFGKINQKFSPAVMTAASTYVSQGELCYFAHFALNSCLVYCRFRRGGCCIAIPAHF